MTHIEALRAELVASPAVTALVGLSPSRIYPVVAPQNVGVPFIVMTVVSSSPVEALHMLAEDRTQIARVQVDSYAKGYVDAHQLADAVNAVLANLSRADLNVRHEQSADLYDDETQLRRVSADYVVAR